MCKPCEYTKCYKSIRCIVYYLTDTIVYSLMIILAHSNYCMQEIYRVEKVPFITNKIEVDKDIIIVMMAHLMQSEQINDIYNTYVYKWEENTELKSERNYFSYTIDWVIVAKSLSFFVLLDVVTSRFVMSCHVRCLDNDCTELPADTIPPKGQRHTHRGNTSTMANSNTNTKIL